jgi:hypothetical protein
MHLKHSILKKHRGPKRSGLLLATLTGIATIDEFCDRIEENRYEYTSYDSDPSKSPNLWVGDVFELLMEGWFQRSNTINAFHVNKPNEIPHPIMVNDYCIVDRDGGTDEEDHGVLSQFKQCYPSILNAEKCRLENLVKVALELERDKEFWLGTSVYLKKELNSCNE